MSHIDHLIAETAGKSHERTCSPLDFYRLIRSQIEHEDNSQQQRLSWLVASQSFLFTAFAIVLSNLQIEKPSAIATHLQLLVRVLPIGRDPHLRPDLRHHRRRRVRDA